MMADGIVLSYIPYENPSKIKYLNSVDEFICSSFDGQTFGLSHDVHLDIFSFLETPEGDGDVLVKDMIQPIASIPAITYIKNSKKDAKYIGYTKDLEYAFILESKRHLFLYKNPGDEIWGEQFIIDLGHEEWNLGVQEVDGKLAILREKSILFVDL
jgi:hypothetical protein